MKDFQALPMCSDAVIDGHVQLDFETGGPELNDAELRESGVMVLDRKKIKGWSKIGKWLKNAGLVEVARGKLAGRMNALERARNVMMELIEDKVVCMSTDTERPVVHHEVVLAATSALVAIIGMENKSDELDLELEKKIGTALPSATPTNRLPPDNIGYTPCELGQVGT